MSASKTLQLIAAFGLASLPLLSQASAPTLEQVLNRRPQSSEVTASSVTAARLKVLREAGLQYGMQAGLAYGYDFIMGELEKRAKALDTLYPFSSLVLEGNVIPPVLKEVRDVFDLTSAKTLRLADREVVLKTPPRFAHGSPSWRDYVAHNFTFDDKAVANISPQNDDESKVWDSAVKEGYGLGYDDAFRNLDDDLTACDSDLTGMKLYHQLLVAGKVTKVYVAVSHFGVTGDKNANLKEGESFLKISATPEFVMNPAQWNVDQSAAIEARIRTLVDPEEGAKLVEASGVVKGVDSPNGRRESTRPPKERR